jgi:hypothetical protein
VVAHLRHHPFFSDGTSSRFFYLKRLMCETINQLQNVSDELQISSSSLWSTVLTGIVVYSLLLLIILILIKFRQAHFGLLY